MREFAVAVAMVDGNVYKALRNNMQALQIELIGFVNLWVIQEATERENKANKERFFSVGTKIRNYPQNINHDREERNQKNSICDEKRW